MLERRAPETKPEPPTPRRKGRDGYETDNKYLGNRSDGGGGMGTKPGRHRQRAQRGEIAAAKASQRHQRRAGCGWSSGQARGGSNHCAADGTETCASGCSSEDETGNGENRGSRESYSPDKGCGQARSYAGSASFDHVEASGKNICRRKERSGQGSGTAKVQSSEEGEDRGSARG